MGDVLPVLLVLWVFIAVVATLQGKHGLAGGLIAGLVLTSVPVYRGGVAPARVTFDETGVIIDWRFRRVAIPWDELWSLERVSRPGRYDGVTVLTWRRLDNSTVTMADVFDSIAIADQIERHAPHALVLL